MSHALDKVTIKGFKSIKSLEDFGLKNLNILIGGNGAGKSNFIEFFRMVSAMMKRDGLKEFVAGDADSYMFGGVKRTESIFVKMSYGEKFVKMPYGENGYGFELFPEDDGGFIVKNETVFLGESKVSYKESGRSAILTDVELDLDGFKNISEFIPGTKEYHFHDTSKLAGMRRMQDVIDNEYLRRDGENIAAFLYRLKDEFKEEYKSIVDTVRLVIPFFDDFILKPEKNEKIRLIWRQTGLDGYPMKPNQLSDGAIRFICLATALLQPEPPSTLIIDEPELGLHPYAIEILAEMIQVAAQRMQVIVSTQSSTLVDYFKPEDIIVVNRENGASEFKRLNKGELKLWLEDYSLG